jgi:hypothetical protein
VTAQISATSTSLRLEVLETTITAPGSTEAQAGTGETLPFTGYFAGAIGGIAFALITLGGLALLAIRRRADMEGGAADGWHARRDTYHPES